MFIAAACNFVVREARAMILNIILCFLAYIPGVIHAILVVNKYYADKRHKEMLDAIRRR